MRSIHGVGFAISLLLLGWTTTPAQAQDFDPVEYRLGMNAKILCSGVFVQGRPPELHVREDLARFDHFGWGADFEYEVDPGRERVTLTAEGGRSRSAQYSGDQGCSILPEGADGVFFEPSEVGHPLANPEAIDWPNGDRLPADPFPPEVDGASIEAALDYAFDEGAYEPYQNTRAVIAVYKGRIIGERYAPGWAYDTPQLSWSQGKSITSALIGVLIEQGELTLEQPAPIAEWSGPRDPRKRIRVVDLLRMSSGLDFNNWGIGRPWSLSPENRHFRIYFDAVDVFELAVSVPAEFPPNRIWRYRNSDPLALGKIVREKAEARGESYHAFPWTHLFDKIGIRDAVLETDAWGNFIMTGYDYMSARDWARFGLLHLWDGAWSGERILPEGWREFVSTPAPADESSGYGGLFWLNAGGRYDRIPEDAFWSAGFMGQYTFVIPSRDVVIVRLGPSPGRFDPYINEVVGRILDAVGATGEPGGR
jgi:CubicO group peptidase (beta-lactamase class C family)